MKAVFFGRVNPERAHFTHEGEIVLVENGIAGKVLEIIAKVDHNQIVANIDFDEFYYDIPTVKNICKQHVQTFCDLAGLKYQLRWSVEISSFKILDGASGTWGVQSFAFDDIELDEIFGSVDLKSDISLAAIPQLRISLADLRAASEYPDDTGFYSYRAFETIMKYFDGRQSDQLKSMDLNLNIEAEKIRGYLGGSGWKARHGIPDHWTWEKRKSLIRLSSITVFRFLEFLKSGRPLQGDENFSRVTLSQHQVDDA